MAHTPIIGRDDVTLPQKMRWLLDRADEGRWRPDPVALAWAAGVLKDMGDLQLSARCERLLRKIAPNYRRDLT